MSTTDVLNSILTKNFDASNAKFEKYIFLDAQAYINDAQVIRNIKDIVSRYQLDENFTVNLIFISQLVTVPMALERISEVVFFDLPSEEALKGLSDSLFKRLELDQVPKKEIPALEKEKAELVNNIRGLTLFETEQAYLQSFNLYKKISLDFIRDFKKSAIAKTDLLSLLETKVKFDDIGGMENLKKWLQKSSGGWTVEGKKFGLPNLKGLLLVGLPGTGKSLIMKAIGNEWGLPVVSFDPSRIFSSRVGDSESNMRRVLQIIEGMAPCILSIDEIEKGLAGMQSSTFSDSGVTARVIGSFLIWMQECTKPIFTIATANAIQYLPPELISRFDETFFVNLPQDFERQDIFKIHIGKLGRDPAKFDLKCLSDKSKDLSGREIEQVLRESMYDAYHAGKDLDTDVILNVLSKKTNLLTTMAEQLKYLLKWVGFDENKGDGVRARFASSPNSLDISRVQSEIDKMIKNLESKKPFED
jgi:AAA+ superfamily predicted ATPase